MQRNKFQEEVKLNAFITILALRYMYMHPAIGSHKVFSELLLFLASSNMEPRARYSIIYIVDAIAIDNCFYT